MARAAAVQPLLVELGAAAQQRQLRRRIDGAPGLLVDQLAQLQPGAPALQRALEQLRDLAIVGARVEQPAVVLAPPRAAVPGARSKISAVRRTMSSTAGLLAELALQVVASRLARSCQRSSLSASRMQLLQAEALGRRLLEHLAVPAQGAVVVLQLLLVEARDALGPRQALRGLLDLQQADLADLDQRAASRRGPRTPAPAARRPAPCTAMSSSIPSSIVIAPG